MGLLEKIPAKGGDLAWASMASTNAWHDFSSALEFTAALSLVLDFFGFGFCFSCLGCSSFGCLAAFLCPTIRTSSSFLFSFSSSSSSSSSWTISTAMGIGMAFPSLFNDFIALSAASSGIDFGFLPGREKNAAVGAVCAAVADELEDDVEGRLLPAALRGAKNECTGFAFAFAFSFGAVAAPNSSCCNCWVVLPELRVFLADVEEDSWAFRDFFPVIAEGDGSGDTSRVIFFFVCFVFDCFVAL